MYVKPSIRRVGSFGELTMATGYQGGNDTLYTPQGSQNYGYSVDVCIDPPNPSEEC